MQDVSIYRTILETYAGEGLERAHKIGECFDREDWRDYGIYIHALKSSSKTIGAGELSDLAARLEAAAREEDAGTILKDHFAAMDMFEKIAAVISKYTKDRSLKSPNSHLPDTADTEDDGRVIIEFSPRNTK